MAANAGVGDGGVDADDADLSTPLTPKRFHPAVVLWDENGVGLAGVAFTGIRQSAKLTPLRGRPPQGVRSIGN
jgi:hypothetical protein